MILLKEIITMTNKKVVQNIDRSIEKRLKRIVDDDIIDKRNMGLLLELYQLKAWVGGDK